MSLFCEKAGVAKKEENFSSSSALDIKKISYFCNLNSKLHGLAQKRMIGIWQQMT